MMPKIRVLVVEREATRRSEIVGWLEAGGYEAVAPDNGIAALSQFRSSHPGIVVVDLGTDDLQGWDLIARIREMARTPIIICAANPSVEVVQQGFDLQVDGFLAKPFGREDLLQRLSTIAKRVLGEEAWLYQRNGLRVDWRSCEVSVDGQPVELTGTEFRLLKYLIDHKGWVLSHDQILSEVWGPEYQGERDRVKLYVWYLRRKIESDPRDPHLIATKRGLGYTFVG